MIWNFAVILLRALKNFITNEFSKIISNLINSGKEISDKLEQRSNVSEDFEKNVNQLKCYEDVLAKLNQY